MRRRDEHHPGDEGERFDEEGLLQQGVGRGGQTHLVEGHLAALRHLEKAGRSLTCNLGTGRGYSVLEVVAAFERASGKKIPLDYRPRRAGDIAAYWADPALARRELGWQAKRGLAEMCRDAWRWQSLNPDGYV